MGVVLSVVYHVAVVVSFLPPVGLLGVLVVWAGLYLAFFGSVYSAVVVVGLLAHFEYYVLVLFGCVFVWLVWWLVHGFTRIWVLFLV